MSNLWTQVPSFTGAHVTLRPLVAEDRDALVAAASDGKLWDCLLYTSPSPRD